MDGEWDEYVRRLEMERFRRVPEVRPPDGLDGPTRQWMQEQAFQEARSEDEDPGA